MSFTNYNNKIFQNVVVGEDIATLDHIYEGKSPFTSTVWPKNLTIIPPEKAP